MIYGSLELDFPDRTLQHLEIVIVAKLRRREGFLFSWRAPREAGSGRRSLWLAPSIPMSFSHDSPHQDVNAAWLNSLAASANTATGLVLTAEPVPPARPWREGAATGR